MKLASKKGKAFALPNLVEFYQMDTSDSSVVYSSISCVVCHAVLKGNKLKVKINENDSSWFMVSFYLKACVGEVIQCIIKM